MHSHYEDERRDEFDENSYNLIAGLKPPNPNKGKRKSMPYNPYQSHPHKYNHPASYDDMYHPNLFIGMDSFKYPEPMGGPYYGKPKPNHSLESR